MPIGRKAYFAIKRVIDVIGAIVGLIVFGPFMVLSALAIKLDSAGPVFFAQDAVGRDGRVFRMLKLRSMRHGASNKDHARFTRDYVQGSPAGMTIDPATGEPVYKIVADPRITRVGRLLRRTGLDETPQFFNVLRGDMSLVGPRPPLPNEYSLYDDWARGRLVVKPGVTGLCQVRRRGRASFREMVQADLEYIETMSLGLDLRLIAQTIAVLVKGQGAF